MRTLAIVVASAVASVLLILFTPDTSIAQWTPVQAPVPPRPLDAAVRGDTLFAICNSPGAAQYSSGIYSSSDQGDHWAFLGASPDGSTSLFMYGNELFAYGASYLLRSADGISWEKCTPQSIALLFAVDDSVLLAPAGNSLYRSTDHGHSWTEPAARPFEYPVFGFALVGDTILAGGHFLYRSTDKGKSWTRTGEGGEDWYGINFTLFSAPVSGGPTAVFALDYNRLFQSTDCGRSWFRSDQGVIDSVTGTEPDLLSMAALNDTLYLFTSCVAFASRDGQSWAPALDFSDLPPGRRLIIAPFGEIHLAEGWGLSRRSRGESLWKNIGAGLPAGQCEVAGVGPALFARNTDFSSRSAFSSNRILRSVDGGSSWQWSGHGLGGNTFRSNPVAFEWRDSVSGHSLTHLLALVGWQKIGHSIDWGASWTLVQPTFLLSLSPDRSFEPVISLAPWLRGSTKPMLLGGMGASFGMSITGLWLSEDLGETWKPLRWNSGDSWNGYTTIGANDSVIVTCFDGTSLRSTDQGNTWQAVRGVTAPWKKVVGWDSLFFAGVTAWGQGVLRSSDYGASWELLYPGTDMRTEPWLTGCTIDTVGRLLFLEADRQGESVLWLSADGGNSWVDAGDGLKGSRVTTVARVGGDIYAGTLCTGVWKRSLAELLAAEKPLVWRLCRLIYPESGATFAQSPMLFTWHPMSAAAMQYIVRIFRPIDNLVVESPPLADTSWIPPAGSIPGAGSYTWQVMASDQGNQAEFYSPLRNFTNGVTGIEESGNLPAQCMLAQNWPNPFNAATNIAYTVGVHSSQFTVHSTDVRLVVYDLLGREVAVLVNERQGPGRYTVKFDGRGLGSGVYFYRLVAGSFVQTRKLLLLR